MKHSDLQRPLKKRPKYFSLRLMNLSVSFFFFGGRGGTILYGYILQRIFLNK